MSEQTCAYCGTPITFDDPWIGPQSKKPYCPDRLIDKCFAAQGARVEYIDYTYQPATT